MDGETLLRTPVLQVSEAILAGRLPLCRLRSSAAFRHSPGTCRAGRWMGADAVLLCGVASAWARRRRRARAWRGRLVTFSWASSALTMAHRDLAGVLLEQALAS